MVMKEEGKFNLCAIKDEKEKKRREGRKEGDRVVGKKRREGIRDTEGWMDG